GETSGRWWLLSRDARTAAELRGKRLAFAQTGGRDEPFVDEALLEGALPGFFGARGAAPDVASAVSAVSLGRAHAVLASAAAAGLVAVLDHPPRRERGPVRPPGRARRERRPRGPPPRRRAAHAAGARPLRGAPHQLLRRARLDRLRPLAPRRQRGLVRALLTG